MEPTRRAKPLLFFITCLVYGLVAGLANIAPLHAQSAPFRTWGLETLRRVQTQYTPSNGDYLAEAIVPGKPAPNKPVFMWGCGVYLTALNAAARLDKATIPALRRFVFTLEDYWHEHNKLFGYDVQPGPKAPDRYYDDNIWITLALCDTYEITHDAQYRNRAEQTFAFVLSGEDDKLGGGIYWHEQERNLKGADCNGSATAAALRLHQITGKAKYLAIARRLYDWTNAHLQDKDGLFFDALEVNGTLHPMKWTYNAALMIRANTLFYEITHEARYLTEAKRIARAAEARWIKPETGAIMDEGWFAHLLAEAWLFLGHLDGNAHWKSVVTRALIYLHDKTRDPNGYHGKRWDTLQPANQATVPLLYEVSAARAYLMVAQFP